VKNERLFNVVGSDALSLMEVAVIR
jgi:hypothetical protein